VLDVIEWKLRGKDEVLEMYEKADVSDAETQKALDAGIKVFRDEIKRRAGSGGIPRRFGNTKVRHHRNPLGISTAPKSPLSSIFEVGAGGHNIGQDGQLLANAASGFFARAPVAHPGMSARPLIGPAFEAA
jgi:hypothetical protein